MHIGFINIIINKTITTSASVCCISFVFTSRQYDLIGITVYMRLSYIISALRTDTVHVVMRYFISRMGSRCNDFITYRTADNLIIRAAAHTSCLNFIFTTSFLGSVTLGRNVIVLIALPA